jgi:energy-coupling factor transporter ATP-binding protein EcfA2
MFIDRLGLENVRTFVKEDISFVHPDKEFAPKGSKSKDPPPRPRLPNVNLLLGDNGSGKSTILRMIALAAFGPAVKESGLRDPGLVRRANGHAKHVEARLAAKLVLHEQDWVSGGWGSESAITVKRRGDLDIYDFAGPDPGGWEAVYESKNEACFIVGYGATRRVERAENFDMGARTKNRFARAQRVASLFEDWFSLIPLTYWLPDLKKSNRGRYTQVVHLLNRLLGPGHYRFTEEMEQGDYLFERGGLHIPFQNLSDGYRAFVGWVADLLYHVCYGCPPGKKLVESYGVVLVDEIDLHLHPKWQMKVIPTVAKALPRMQFVFTSHSPLVAGSLEWMNILTLKVGAKTNRTVARRLRESVHGLDADQILLTDFFGLKTTRAPGKVTQLEELRRRARHGDKDAARQLILAMSRGTEEAG